MKKKPKNLRQVNALTIIIFVCAIFWLMPLVLIFINSFKPYNDMPVSYTHLDVYKRQMQELARSGMTMVVVTHEMGFAREVATRVLFIDEGKIQEENSPKEFFANPKNKRLREFLSKTL